MSTATGCGGEGALQLPFYPRTAQENTGPRIRGEGLSMHQRNIRGANEILDANAAEAERRMHLIDEMAPRFTRVEEARRFATPGASFDLVHNGHGIRESYIRCERVERVAATTAEPDYRYDFEYELNPPALLELEKRVGAWLKDPAFTREREYAKELCEHDREWSSHSRLTVLSTSMRMNNASEIKGGTYYGRDGQTTHTYGIWENMTSVAQGVQSCVNSAGCYWLQTPSVAIRQADVLHQMRCPATACARGIRVRA